MSFYSFGGLAFFRRRRHDDDFGFAILALLALRGGLRELLSFSYDHHHHVTF